MPARLAATKPYRLSFSRSLIRTMSTERWRIETETVELDADGNGRASYRIITPGHVLTFAVFSQDVPERHRTGRIAEPCFDGMGFLYDGIPGDDRIEFERSELLKRSGGRTDWHTIGWTLATRSSASVEYVVDSLARGTQPEQNLLLEQGGYLIRNNGFYGNGRHGSRTWTSLPASHPLSEPYRPEMLTLYLWRQFGFDLVQSMAVQRSQAAAVLSNSTMRVVGLGNSSGQGMSTLLIKQPDWMQSWSEAREQAFEHCVNTTADSEAITRVAQLIDRAGQSILDRDRRDNPFGCPTTQLRADLGSIRAMVPNLVTSGDSWERLAIWAQENTHLEALETFLSILTETYSASVDELSPMLRGRMTRKAVWVGNLTVRQLEKLISDRYQWSFELATRPEHSKFFFYYSEEEGEPRVGYREIDPGAEYETFTSVPQAVLALDDDLRKACPDQTVARFLVSNPEHRYIVERVLGHADDAYAEIRSNATSPQWIASDVSRFVLGTFGMENAYAPNHRYVLGVFFQGAPTSEDIAGSTHTDWIYPDNAPVVNNPGR